MLSAIKNRLVAKTTGTNAARNAAFLPQTSNQTADVVIVVKTIKLMMILSSVVPESGIMYRVRYIIHPNNSGVKTSERKAASDPQKMYAAIVVTTVQNTTNPILSFKMSSSICS